MSTDYQHTSSTRPSLYQRIKQNHVFQKLMRTLQFLSATISFGLFTARLVKILRIGYKAYRASNGAVEGILCAAVAYTLISMIIRFLLKKKAPPSFLRWLWIIFDLLFIGGFIAVAYETRSNGGTSGPCNSRLNTVLRQNDLLHGANCNLPWGTFILAIVSTILHFLTVVFNEARDHYRHHKQDKLDHEANGNGRHGHGGHGHGHNQQYQQDQQYQENQGYPQGGMQQQGNGRAYY